MAAKCKNCKLSYIPPRLYCEECFEKLESWTPIESEGVVGSYTLAYVQSDGTRLREPKVLAFITFGNVKGGMIHHLGNLGKKKIEIGMRVRPSFRAKPQRIGSMTDIEYFEPV